MGEMEPRYSASNCGGVESHSFVQACNKDGSGYNCSGMAMGSMLRPLGGCFQKFSGLKLEEPKPMCSHIPGKPSWQKDVMWKCSERSVTVYYTPLTLPTKRLV